MRRDVPPVPEPQPRPELSDAQRLTFVRTSDMVSHMKTTLTISDVVMKALKREAAATGRTMSELVEAALRNLLKKRHAEEDIGELPSFDGGKARVDVANRDVLYEVMEAS